LKVLARGRGGRGRRKLTGLSRTARAPGPASGEPVAKPARTGGQAGGNRARSAACLNGGMGREERWDAALVHAFGAALRRARHCAGLSQQRLALLAGVSQTLISRLERGQAAHVGLSRILAIQTALGGCLPLGFCPHDHACIWQPRTDAERQFPPAR